MLVSIAVTYLHERHALRLLCISVRDLRSGTAGLLHARRHNTRARFGAEFLFLALGGVRTAVFVGHAVEDLYERLIERLVSVSIRDLHH